MPVNPVSDKDLLIDAKSFCEPMLTACYWTFKNNFREIRHEITVFIDKNVFEYVIF